MKCLGICRAGALKRLKAAPAAMKIVFKLATQSQTAIKAVGLLRLRVCVCVCGNKDISDAERGRFDYGATANLHILNNLWGSLKRLGALG